MTDLWLTWGLPGLFLVAFLAATILPFSSEGALLGMLMLGAEPWSAFAVASLGNGLGALTNVAIGWFFAERAQHALRQSKAGHRALSWGARYGPLALIASPLPVIGDPTLLAAGLLRLPLRWILSVGIGLRVLRYIPIIFPFL